MVGAGGATNIRKVCRLLRDLDYTKVVGIFDADQPKAKAKCEAGFPDYRFVLLPADDIRDKAAVNARPAKSGLWKSGEGLDELNVLRLSRCITTLTPISRVKRGRRTDCGLSLLVGPRRRSLVEHASELPLSPFASTSYWRTFVVTCARPARYSSTECFVL